MTDAPCLQEDERGLVTAEWLVIACVLLGAVVAAFEIVRAGEESAGNTLADRIVHGGQGGGVGASAPGVGASAPPPPPAPRTRLDEIKDDLTNGWLGGGALNGYGGGLVWRALHGETDPFRHFVRGALMGGFADDTNVDEALGDVIGSAVLGAIPYVGEAAGIRDTAAGIGELVDSHFRSPVAWVDTGLGLVGLIPEAGESLRGVGRTVRIVRAAGHGGDALNDLLTVLLGAHDSSLDPVDNH